MPSDTELRFFYLFMGAKDIIELIRLKSPAPMKNSRISTLAAGQIKEQIENSASGRCSWTCFEPRLDIWWRSGGGGSQSPAVRLHVHGYRHYRRCVGRRAAGILQSRSQGNKALVKQFLTSKFCGTVPRPTGPKPSLS